MYWSASDLAAHVDYEEKIDRRTRAEQRRSPARPPPRLATRGHRRMNTAGPIQRHPRVEKVVARPPEPCFSDTTASTGSGWPSPPRRSPGDPLVEPVRQPDCRTYP
jgi:hypothetical protein